VAVERGECYVGGVKADFMSRFGPLFFATAGTVIVLWQMLLPGYVLTWDMVFGPSHTFPMFSGFLNGAPLRFLIYGAGFLVPMWLVQKGILIALFFSLFYLPIRFFPFQVEAWVRYAAAALYAVNPFVYERFLAGQWGVLAAYALLAPFVYFLLELVRTPRVRTAATMALIMLLVGVFSLHAFVMTVLVAIVVVAIAILRDVRGALPLAKYASLAACIVGIVSLYWVVPYVLNPGSSPLQVFTKEHWGAFETSTDSLLGTSGNVLALYGFWGESYPWMQTLLSPKETPIVFFPALLTLLALVMTSATTLLRARETRTFALILVGIGAAAFVFSVGLAPSFFHELNLWLFQHVPFWSGFRDTEKWSMWLALTYAYLFAAGAAFVVARVRSRAVPIVRLAFVLLPFVYTFTMLGFAGQLKPVEYPASWYEVNAILAEDSDCKALFLPWHQYYPLAFNNDMLTANPASRFFDCAIVSSKDAEIGEVGEQGSVDPSYRAIAEAVTSNDPQIIDFVLSVLRSEGVRYVIFTGDLLKNDHFTYPFLRHPELTPIYEKVVHDELIVLLKI